MKRVIKANSQKVIELQAELFYDTVHNLGNAGWDDVLSFFRDNGWVSGNALTIPEGITLTEVDRDRYWIYFEVSGPKSSAELPFSRDSISEIIVD